MRFKTSAGKEFFQRTSYQQGGPSPWLKTHPGGEFVDCALQVTADTTADWLRVQFPRSCINRPRWFRVAVTSVHYTQTQQWYDDAHKPTAYAEDEWTYSARIRKPS